MKTENGGRGHSEVRLKSRRLGGTQKWTLRKVNTKYTRDSWNRRGGTKTWVKTRKRKKGGVGGGS